MNTKFIRTKIKNFKKFEIKPRNEAWTKLENQLQKKKRAESLMHFTIGIAVVFIILIAIFGIILHQNSKSSSLNTNENIIKGNPNENLYSNSESLKITSKQLISNKMQKKAEEKRTQLKDSSSQLKRNISKSLNNKDSINSYYR